MLGMQIRHCVEASRLAYCSQLNMKPKLRPKNKTLAPAVRLFSASLFRHCSGFIGRYGAIEVKRMTTNQRKLAVVRSLYSIGESDIAADFAQATEKCSFEYCEHVLRTKLKALGGHKHDTRRIKILANAIVEAQCLPALTESESAK